MAITFEEVATVLKEGAAFVTSLAALVAAISAHHTANKAKRAAETAHEKASEAVREQINFGLRRVAKETVEEIRRKETGARKESNT